VGQGFADIDEQEDACAGEYRLASPLVNPMPISPPPIVSSFPSTSFLDRQTEIRVEVPDPPPRWTFFSGVFSFPWSPGALPRWAYLSCGCIAVGAVGVMTASVASQMSGYSGVTLAFFALPQIWLTLWTLSFAAACCLRILEDTAAGNNHVREWPEPNWREWAAQFIYVGYLGLIAACLGYGVGWATSDLGGPGRLVGLLAGLSLWPILLLSSLEADNIWAPISGPVLRSLFSEWWAWLLFYGESLVLMGAYVGLLLAGLRWQPLLAILITGPLLAALFLIEARLLGRLAWRISQDRETEF
jgi:hypothetical protein